MTSLLDAVRAATSNPNEQATLLYACGAETGCQSIQNAGGYPAYGPWQIALPYHPDVTQEQANDPVFAASFMARTMGLARCTAAQGGLWVSNPTEARLRAARCLEVPGVPYSAAQQASGNRFADMATNAPGAAPTATIDPGKIVNGGTPFNLPGIPNPLAEPMAMLTKLMGALYNPDFYISLLLVMGGFALALMGTGHLLSGQAVKAAPLAAAAAA